MRYLPHTENDVRRMLERIGVSSIDALFESIPADKRLSRPLDLAPALDEDALMTHLTELASRNEAAGSLSFLGGGMYHHHVPPAVDQLLMRGEFYTAYTPYQAEVAQGTLQSIFEFQTLVCQLLGMEVANASMYDGASATAEAVLMARRITGHKRYVLSEGLHPEYIATVRSYLQGNDEGNELVLVPLDASGRTDRAALAEALNDKVASVVLGYPNFFGCVEDLQALTALAHDHGALCISVTMEPYALSLLKSPGDLGVDIAVGEGQALAISPQFGGPGVGLFACRERHVRQMPGRLVGETVDTSGRRGYVLTLSTREQHIRREKATSNICTNHGLIALAMAIRVALLGRSGFVSAGKLCLRGAEYLKQRILATGAFELPYSAPTFNEFVIRSKRRPAAEIVDALAKEHILAGVALDRFDPKRTNDLLVAVTERHSPSHLDRFATALASV